MSEPSIFSLLPFVVRVPKRNAPELALELRAGGILYIVGRNGSGKSALVHYLAKVVPRERCRCIIAHRQIWIPDTPFINSSNRDSYEGSILTSSYEPRGRIFDQYPFQRVELPLFDL